MSFIKGTNDSDYLLGTEGKDKIEALAGNDTVIDLGGSDTVNAGEGDDDVQSIFSKTSVDTIDGGGGKDRLTLFADSAADNRITINDGKVSNGTTFRNIEEISLTATTADDTINIFANKPTTVGGGDGNDSISLGAGDDFAYGEKGNDSLIGGDGDDFLDADSETFRGLYQPGNGNDTLVGGNGNDTLIGGGAADMMTGGLGKDTFAYTQPQDEGGDTITDFSASDDVISLHLGSNAISDGQIQWSQVGNDTLVKYDLDGSSGSIDAVNLVTLSNLSANNLSASNFV